jgi:hypothetical protein
MAASAFATALDVLFANPNLGVNAIYRTGGANPGTTLRAIIRQPDRVGIYAETRIATETTIVDIRASDIKAPAEGDTIEMDGTVYIIQGEPLRDAERLVWTMWRRGRNAAAGGPPR